MLELYSYGIFGDDFYEALELPDWETASYVVPFRYTKWFHQNQSRKKICAVFDLNRQIYAFDTYLVYAWGSHTEFNPDTMIAVDQSITDCYS